MKRRLKHAARLRALAAVRVFAKLGGVERLMAEVEKHPDLPTRFNEAWWAERAVKEKAANDLAK